MIKKIKNLLTDKTLTIISKETSKEDLEKTLNSFEEIHKVEYYLNLDEISPDLLNKKEDYSKENFDNWIKNQMISSNAEIFKIVLELSYKGVPTGYNLSFKAINKKGTFKYRYNGVYGYLVPIFGKAKAFYYMMFYYVFGKKDREFIQDILNELIWTSNMKITWSV